MRLGLAGARVREAERAAVMPKPPLGVLPRYLWAEQYPTPTALQVRVRRRVLLEAMLRYEQAGVDEPRAWLDELVELRGNP